MGRFASVLWGLSWILSLGCQGARADSDTLVVLVEASVEGLDPRYAVSGYGVKLSRLISGSLVSLDSTDLSVRMELAEAVDQTGPRTYVVRLRPQARFSDGTPVLARDVAATFQSMAASSSASPYHFVWSRVAKMEILGPRRLRIRLRSPHAPFLTDLDMGILPAHQARRQGRVPDTEILAAGPYRVLSRSRDVIRLQANPYYFRGPPKIPRVLIRTVRDDTARLLMLAGGSADLSQNTVPPLLLPAVARHRSLRILAGRSVTHTYMGLNLRHPALRDVRVRRALALALDRRAVIQAKFGGRARLSASILSEDSWAYERRLRQVPFDPGRAERLLDEAGWPRGRDGWRFSLLYKTSNNPFRVGVARTLAAMLRRVGVRVRVQPYEWGVFYSDVKKGNFELFSMQMTEVAVPDYHYHFFHSASQPGASLLRVLVRELRWLARQLDACGRRAPDCRLDPAWLDLARDYFRYAAGERLPELLAATALGPAERSVAGANRFHYVNTEVDWLLDVARYTSDRGLQKSLYGRVQLLIARDLPIVFLWHEDNVAVLRACVRGFRVLPNARLSSLPQVTKSCP